MMTTKAAAMLALLVLSAVVGSTLAGEGTTYISNKSSRTITATTSYSPDSSGVSLFINRNIPPGTYQSDAYSLFVDFVHIELWVERSQNYKSVQIRYDRSIVAYNNQDVSGVDIFLARYGTRVHTDGPALITLFP